MPSEGGGKKRLALSRYFLYPFPEFLFLLAIKSRLREYYQIIFPHDMLPPSETFHYSSSRIMI